jgi:hypothetical protein
VDFFKNMAHVISRCRKSRYPQSCDFAVDANRIEADIQSQQFDGYFKQVNPVWSQTLDHSNEELLAQPYLAFVHPDDRASTAAEAESLFRAD